MLEKENEVTLGETHRTALEILCQICNIPVKN